MMAGWISFILCTMIRYHGLLRHVKYNLRSVPNLSNYGNCFIKLKCCDISEKNVVIYFISGTVIGYMLLMLVK